MNIAGLIHELHADHVHHDGDEDLPPAMAITWLERINPIERERQQSRQRSVGRQ